MEHDHRKRKKGILWWGLLFMSIGFIMGAEELVRSDTWINGSNYLYPNSSYSNNVNISGYLYVNNSLVCTLGNGLCSYNTTNNYYNVSGNSSFNQTLTDVLYYSRDTNPLGFYNLSTLPAYPVGDNTSWNQSLATTLYYSISNPLGFISSYTETDPYYNRSWNETRGNTIYAPISTISDNTTWNQALAVTLFYPLNTNPLVFYNSTTIAGLFVTTSNGTAIYNNITRIDTAITDLQSANNTNNQSITNLKNIAVTIGSANLTTLSCSNITGATSNLCTITSGGSGGGWINTSSSVSLSNNATNISVGNGSGTLPNLYIDETGDNVGIKTTKPINDFYVNGTINATTNIFVGSTPVLTAVPVMNITFKEAYYPMSVASGVGATTITSYNSSAKCSSFRVEQGTQVVFSNISLFSVISNASLGIGVGIYNCTSQNATTCSNGTLIINTTLQSYNKTGFFNLQNTTGNWILPSGYYVACVTANVSASGATARSGTATTGIEGIANLPVKGGAFNRTTTQFSYTNTVTPFIWLRNNQ